MSVVKMSQSRSSEDPDLYWKNRAEELERELEDFREQSHDLEKELEASLEQAEKRARDFRVHCNKLQLENDTLKNKLEQVTKESTTQINSLQEELSQCRNREEKFLKYIRELEQKNDDLERTQRAMYVSLGEFETKMNLAIERNALLESELDEKESLQAMVQRLKDEARDMKQEIVIHKRQEKNDNEKCIVVERRSSPVDSNKLVTAEMETQTITSPSPIKTIGPNNNNALPPPTRISAMNIVGDLLRKVGALESKIASCRNPYRESPLTTENGNETFHEYPRHNTFSGRRLNRGTSTPTIQNYIRS
ncbi:nuclear distribution protein nudE-like 1-B isoform X3 [Frankliniella occidentalis]|uniref:Nuclear distribution protein nudE-like 1-B isoform X3 n=1 Tax=Frankliniella occidentalis TaxID=133901 RepID=A0A6J1TKL7_FRAOC|nr:nuclear distribution protein nudE-like 1-B isoform X3 [Frankliniella occidentalis]